MKLPNYEQAYVPEAKIVKYLLNLDDKSKGKDKAQFFTRFGFSVAQWKVMEAALLLHAQTHEVASTLDTPEGIHYSIEGALNTPDQRNPQVRTIWAIDTGSTSARFITAYPLKKEKSR
jgi:hypothetical protein